MVTRRYEQIPKLYRGIYKKAVTGKRRKAAIHAFCLECVCWQIKEVEITVFDLTDIEMIRSIADENLPHKRSLAVAVQTILAAKEYIEMEIAKYKSLEKLKLTAHAGVSRLFADIDRRHFLRLKRQGVGEKLKKNV